MGKHKPWRFKAPHTTVQERSQGHNIWDSDTVSYLHVCCRPAGWHGASSFPSLPYLLTTFTCPPCPACTSEHTTVHQASNNTKGLLPTHLTFPYCTLHKFLRMKPKPSPPSFTAPTADCKTAWLYFQEGTTRLYDNKNK